MDTSLSVKQLIQIPSFKKCTLLTGEVGLERKISGFVVADNIDVFNGLQGGELVCSPAGGFRDPLPPKSRMMDLYNRKASVWVFRLGTPNDIIPKDLISLAV